VEADIERIAEFYSGAVSELSVMRGGRVLIGLNGRDGSPVSSFAKQLATERELVVVGLLGGVAGSAGHLVGDAVSDGTGPGTGMVGCGLVSYGMVGYGTCRLLELSDGERVGSVGDLYVVPEARRHGVGKAMADYIVSWCAEQGCIGVDADALPGSRAVKSFFEAGGFTARVLVMHRRLT
jgi:GNAT superfamily N-acetyltransferase